MCAPLSGLTPITSLRLLACTGGLLLGVLFGTGCAPNSSGSSTPPDTTSVSPTTAPSPDTSERAPTDSPPTAETAEDRTVAERLEDASRAARVKQALVRNRSLRPFDFVPTVVQGHLTLRGDVQTREQYREAERVASTVTGVRSVTNQVTVKGRAVTDADDSAPTDEDRAAYHTVRRGDTLTEIARAYDVSVQQLRRLNDLSETLRPGQEIRVR